MGTGVEDRDCDPTLELTDLSPLVTLGDPCTCPCPCPSRTFATPGTSALTFLLAREGVEVEEGIIFLSLQAAWMLSSWSTLWNIGHITCVNREDKEREKECEKRRKKRKEEKEGRQGSEKREEIKDGRKGKKKSKEVKGTRRK